MAPQSQGVTPQLKGQFAQGAAGLPGQAAVPQAAYPPAQPGSRLGGLMREVKGLVKDLVQVNVQDTSGGDPNVHVKVPFVNVDVKDGKRNVNVHAPFVNVNKSDGGSVSVKAPFTSIGAGNASGQSQPAPVKTGN
jgi:hypothetical protein